MALEQPKLMILDVMMHGPTGLEVCRALRDPDTNKIGSSSCRPAARSGTWRKGWRPAADHYITKPFDYRELIGKIRELLSMRTTINGAERMAGSAIGNKSQAPPGVAVSRVLVVDDETAIRKGLVYLLHKEGYEVLEAANGREALSLVFRERPDLVLLDLMLPLVNGHAVCRELKSREDTRLIPIVMITANHSQEEKLKAIEAGADDFLNKPINLPELRVRLRSLLRMKHLNDMLDSNETVIAAMANAIEAKDRYTEGHNERVAAFAVALARAAGLSQREQELVRMAGILHDVGKIGVPDQVLNKPGVLSEEEFRCIHEHPVHGGRILEPLQSLREVREVVLYHHERFDGRGYPEGLAGEGIPLYARIVAIADSYDAMTSDRPYRAGLTREEALNELLAKAGEMWDPELVTIFVELARDGGLTFPDRY